MHLHVLIALALVFLSHVTYTVAQRGPAPPTARKIVEFEFEPRDSREPEDDGNRGIDGDDGEDGDNRDDGADACNYAGLFLTINQMKKLYNLPKDVTVVCDKEDVPSISRSPGDAGKRNTSCRFAGGRFAGGRFAGGKFAGGRFAGGRFAGGRFAGGRFAGSDSSDSSHSSEETTSYEWCEGSTCCETCLVPVIRTSVPTYEGPWEYVAHDAVNEKYQVWWEARCGERGNCERCDVVHTYQSVLVSDLPWTMLNPRWRWYSRPTYCRCRN